MKTDEAKKLVLSIHTLVDFLFRKGDIDTRVFSRETMQQGSKIHTFYQRKQGAQYLSEYPLLHTFEVDDYSVTIKGRADGIILGTIPTIDEIKSTVAPLEEFYEAQKEWHLAQAKCYAFIYGFDAQIETIDIKLTYLSQIDDSRLDKLFRYNVNELEEEIVSYIRDYLSFYKIIEARIKLRNIHSKNLAFPFAHFRNGQHRLAKYAYALAKRGGVLFVEAPTGIGKTMSTLFPLVKSFADSGIEKIFYLTAKNSGKDAAKQAANILLNNGMVMTYVIITAKEKVCFTQTKECNPDKCPFAIDYYTKLRRIITESLNSYQSFDQEQILNIATREGVCPFELSLDLSLYADLIICDYNYVYDPMVYLRRYFDENEISSFFLVDEAHNLIERAREMYSASFNYQSLKKTKYLIKVLPEPKAYRRAYNRLHKLMKEMKESYVVGNIPIDLLEQTFLNAINNYLTICSSLLKNDADLLNDDFRDFYFDLNRFNKLYDYYDNSFCLYLTNSEKDLMVKLFCLDPSRQIRKTNFLAKGALFFSATLSPSDYYVRVLGADDNAPFLSLPSPFNPAHLLIMVAPSVSIRYKNRDATYENVAAYIYAFVNKKIGNYFVYVPSYEYLEKLLKIMSFNEDVDVFIQNKDMSEEDKEAFLDHFSLNNERTTIGFVIIGGAFGEGIDLVSDRLIGLIVIGVGLPTISFERDLIRDYYEKTDGKGYEYSYLNVGINKIMQAVGRLIRSEDDYGSALLIDDRYLTESYLGLFEKEWRHYKVVMSSEEVEEELEKFYKH